MLTLMIHEKTPSVGPGLCWYWFRKGRGGAGLPTSAAAAAASAAAAAAAGFVFAWFGLVDDEGAAAHLGAVESGDGGVGLLGAAHFDESEATGAAGLTVHDD